MVEGASGIHRSGFVALVGRPNVGKSTLVNSLIGGKIAAVSAKPQTTRTAIRAILTAEDAQIIFIDTPGLHRPKHKLGRSMIRVARAALREADLVCCIVEAHLAPGPGDRFIAAALERAAGPVFLVMNKLDLVSPERLAVTAALYEGLFSFAASFSLSALRKEGMGPLLQAIKGSLPGGPRYYPPEMVTDQPERFIAAEIIREKIIGLTREEIPHAVAVVVEEITPREGKDLLDMRAEIFVERDSQVGIIVGKGGLLLKDAGSAARREIEAYFGRQIYLDLRVKVRRDWRNRERALHDFGYDEG